MDNLGIAYNAEKSWSTGNVTSSECYGCMGLGGMPRTDNNYIWIQQFYSALNAKGRAGFVIANSASDAHSLEMEIRKQIIQDGGVDVMVAISTLVL